MQRKHDEHLLWLELEVVTTSSCIAHAHQAVSTQTYTKLVVHEIQVVIIRSQLRNISGCDSKSQFAHWFASVRQHTSRRDSRQIYDDRFTAVHQEARVIS